MKNRTASIFRLNTVICRSVLTAIMVVVCTAFSYTDLMEIVLRDDCSATSELLDPDQNNADEEDYFAINKKYGVQNLFDGNIATAWVEGAEGDGIGEAVFMALPDECDSIKIFSGYGKSEYVFKNNGRVKKLKLACFAGIHRADDVTEIADAYKAIKFPKESYIELEDKFAMQSFKFDFEIRELKEFLEEFVTAYKKTSDTPILSEIIILKIEIAAVYKGAKYEDTCISEIALSNKTASGVKTVK
ncbi:MAG: hypothetical protein JXR46_11605 [Calditrichaceae bacterium]|nr:hypothetical protein [Calditrichaceae bacterium]MBN2709681.1 hypothetical protein [Calditrichaceae bacterium]RQV95039.1 MAG: hypothetical protein EH224_08645 [Calditrichota bacterium]